VANKEKLKAAKVVTHFTAEQEEIIASAISVAVKPLLERIDRIEATLDVVKSSMPQYAFPE